MFMARTRDLWLRVEGSIYPTTTYIGTLMVFYQFIFGVDGSVGIYRVFVVVILELVIHIIKQNKLNNTRIQLVGKKA